MARKTIDGARRATLCRGSGAVHSWLDEPRKSQGGNGHKIFQKSTAIGLTDTGSRRPARQKCSSCLAVHAPSGARFSGSGVLLRTPASGAALHKTAHFGALLRCVPSIANLLNSGAPALSRHFPPHSGIRPGPKNGRCAGPGRAKRTSQPQGHGSCLSWLPVEKGAGGVQDLRSGYFRR
jgi:hypothetical protein